MARPLFICPEPAQRGRRDAQIRGDVAQVCPAAHFGKLALECLVTLFGGQGQSLLVAPVQATVLVLVDDAPPVAPFDIGLEKMGQVGQLDPVGLDLLECLDELLAQFVVVELVHTEDDASFEREGGRDLLAVDQPERAGHAFFQEIGIFAEDVFLDKLIAFREMTQGHDLF